VDLATYWKERRWATLIGLIDELPSNSLTHEAMANDEELASEFLKNRNKFEQATSGSNKPRISEFGPTESMLAILIDSVSSLQATTVAVNNGKPKKPKSYPRPESAVDRLLREQDRQLQSALLSAFTRPSNQ
jgi:hypothetical protein